MIKKIFLAILVMAILALAMYYGMIYGVVYIVLFISDVIVHLGSFIW
ncbi:hypothetical protein [Klebsiella phage PhiKpNIH-6]|jgi:hypothetical protein|uniref:Uncharacterized protein n=5 Tax=Marfavirus F48 TaxID=2845079 RepID=A0A5P8PKC9_9CAUD|nr:hypothetical protein HWB49_gp141 [Klebsiella phage vB_Kpn_F48]QEG12756.1 hypothetical protein POTTS_146 [Klebsiella phage vB_KpnM_Potts1]QEM42489.1 putative transmembrane protein [Klebsiella phage EI]QFR57085.1 hypothetical protein AmPhEK29_0148 [Klebsiella phage AmPh_EK29]QGZ15047.1 hypothetical protein [Klebsiella phage vB_Kpn_P545]QHB49341.1 hypothetical protein [Klebsiella phage PhiKpNIH-6]UEP19364.1 putative membrane protein [Klebsiella phage vB_KpnM-VAC36]UJD05381.1 hypothetical pro